MSSYLTEASLWPACSFPGHLINLWNTAMIHGPHSYVITNTETIWHRQLITFLHKFALAICSLLSFMVQSSWLNIFDYKKTSRHHFTISAHTHTHRPHTCYKSLKPLQRLPIQNDILLHPLYGEITEGRDCKGSRKIRPGVNSSCRSIAANILNDQSPTARLQLHKGNYH